VDKAAGKNRLPHLPASFLREMGRTGAIPHGTKYANQIHEGRGSQF